MVPGHKPSIHIRVLGQNKLSVEYLLEILSSDRVIIAKPLTTLSELSASEKSHLIFVVDNRGFEVALSECIRRIRIEAPQARFIILDQSLAVEEIARMLWFGVHGFLDHEEVRKALLHAVHRVAEGGLWFSPKLVQEFVEHGALLRQKGTSTQAALTLKEREVLELVRRRLSNKEIAEIMGICESTVKFHLSHVLSKLQATTRRDLFKKPEISSIWSKLFFAAERSRRFA